MFNQLPIPDWGLNCPHCGEALAGLSDYCCRKCGKRFSIQQVLSRHRPIPDIGLECPQCEYNLTGLMESRCPECGQAFSIYDLLDALWDPAIGETAAANAAADLNLAGRPSPCREPIFTGQERPLPEFGLHCLSCQRSLVGAVRDSCPHCDVPFDLAAYAGHGEWVTLNPLLPPLSWLTVLGILSAAQIPHWTDDGRVAAWYVTDMDLQRNRLRVPNRFLFDALYELHRAASPGTAIVRAPWTCPSCMEEVPPGFEVCWSCGSPRPRPDKTA